MGNVTRNNKTSPYYKQKSCSSANLCLINLIGALHNNGKQIAAQRSFNLSFRRVYFDKDSVHEIAKPVWCIMKKEMQNSYIRIYWWYNYICGIHNQLLRILFPCCGVQNNRYSLYLFSGTFSMGLGSISMLITLDVVQVPSLRQTNARTNTDILDTQEFETAYISRGWCSTNLVIAPVIVECFLAGMSRLLKCCSRRKEGI